MCSLCDIEFYNDPIRERSTMTNRKMIPGLRHDYATCVDDAEFFAAIDAAGGWPVGYKFVGFEHTEQRAAGFTHSPHNDGMWTVLASGDDYYLWKLSSVGLQRIADAVRESLTLPPVNVSKLPIRNWRGFRAAYNKTP